MAIFTVLLLLQLAAGKLAARDNKGDGGYWSREAIRRDDNFIARLEGKAVLAHPSLV
jgi:hypothetical protein